MGKYHVPSSCPCCEGTNELEAVSSNEGRPCEYHTRCIDCGHTDYWAYGYFESSTETEVVCDTYG